MNPTTEQSSTMFRRRVLLGLTLALLALGPASGCGRGFTITTPSGFAELEDQDHYGYRATDAQGVVLAVRREKNEPYGDLSFWSGAVDAQLRRKGYKALKAVDVSAGGVKGKQIRYNVSRAGRNHSFWMTVFVTDDVVVTVEVGGDVEYFEKAEEHLVKAISSLQIG